MSPRTGRPKLDNPRTEIRRVRFTQAEDAQITAAAKNKGVTVAEFIRDRALTAARRATPNRTHPVNIVGLARTGGHVSP